MVLAMCHLLAFYLLCLAFCSESIVAFLHTSSSAFLIVMFEIMVLFYIHICTGFHQSNCLISFSVMFASCFLLTLALLKEILAHFSNPNSVYLLHFSFNLLIIFLASFKSSTYNKLFFSFQFHMLCTDI